MQIWSSGNSLLRTHPFRQHHRSRSRETESGIELACYVDCKPSKEVLGFANYFRRFLSGYANIAKPLDEITGRNVQFQWNEERQLAFETLKLALLDAPVLRLADLSKAFQIFTDTSGVALGAVLLQETDKMWSPVAYASRKLNSAERNYTTTEKETLAVIFAPYSWKQYLFKHFDVFTDHQAVLFDGSNSEPIFTLQHTILLERIILLMH